MFLANVKERESIDSFHPTWLSISILMRPRKKPFKIIGLFFFPLSLSLSLSLSPLSWQAASINFALTPGQDLVFAVSLGIILAFLAIDAPQKMLLHPSFTTSLSLFPPCSAKPWRDPFCQLFPGSLFVPHPAKSLSGVWSWLFHGREPRINSTFRDGTLRTSMRLEFFFLSPTTNEFVDLPRFLSRRNTRLRSSVPSDSIKAIIKKFKYRSDGWIFGSSFVIVWITTKSYSLERKLKVKVNEDE